ncbi:hypothetical protein J5X07_04700 [Actinomyces bowdenii]|uniref:Uncharacterized protein n=1 Tax=Actinomyces bowdenii TaxID=131109 RepID=A0A3P1V5B6_9ACTO|nr:hypothetical protein [Actinomyces bowdenii]MBO3724331.1 hypothetical protein [Actinomyces bowdenii]RRD29424.1 hypothetical protein EII10_06275 [Actinomyces bowdenii]
MTTSPHDDAEDRPERDMDAEFAALMGGLGIPDELAGLDPAAGGEADQAGAREDADQGIRPQDVPRNTYGSPARAGAAGWEADDAAEGGTPGGGLTRAQEDEVAALAASLDAQQAAAQEAPRAVKVAVVVTPLTNADALAALCAMRGLECTVVPADSGALAVKQFVSAHSQWDVAELLGGAETEPAEAAELAADLSMISRAGVVLMTADLATDVGIETGLSGTITARRYVSGKAGEEASAGLLLASMDQVVEDILLGQIAAEKAPGAVDSTTIKPPRAMRWLGRGLGRPRP